MTEVLIEKTDFLSGEVSAPPSKGYTHRAIIASSLSEYTSKIKKPLICDDTSATIDACRLLGAEIKVLNEYIEVTGRQRPLTPEDVIFCGESGSTIRFLGPICTLAPGISILTGGSSLRNRPMAPMLEALTQLGVRCYSARGDGRPPIIIFGGGLKGGRVRVCGDVSSQFISGLLFAAPRAEDKVELSLTTRLNSKPYVDMTVDILSKCGVKVDCLPRERLFKVDSGQTYSPLDYEVEGDYSSAAFLLAAAALVPSKVDVMGLRAESLQGDKVIIDLLREMGVSLRVAEDRVRVEGTGGYLKGLRFDASDTPDLVPVLMVLGCFAEGKTVIDGIGRLRWKESDRTKALTSELRKLRGKLNIYEDKVIVKGSHRLEGAEVNSHSDHRVAMALAVAALASEGRTKILGFECVKKSYPNFIQDILRIGGKLAVG
ncbi:MAG: 3-phosphoshikimate 1-carboxyvinyltransferase [Candidatus Bathyarchaeia archaeon]